MWCFIYRLMLSHAMDRDTALPRWTWQHIRSCASCRRYFANLSSLHERLPRAAPLRVVPLSPNLGERAWAIARAESRRTGKNQHTLRRATPMLAWASAAAACLLFIIALFFCFPDGPDNPQGSTDEMVTAMDSWTDLGAMLQGMDLAGEDSAALRELLANPLAVEAERLAEDAESIKKIITAFLPGLSALKNRLQ
jgi:hypothetical protein